MLHSSIDKADDFIDGRLFSATLKLRQACEDASTGGLLVTRSESGSMVRKVRCCILAGKISRDNQETLDAYAKLLNCTSVK